MNFQKIVDNRTFQSFITLLTAFILAWSVSEPALAQMRLPGDDITNDLSALGTLLKLADTLLFKILSRMLAGLAILASAWNLKEQRLGMCFISAFAAVMLGLTPTFVQNIFSVGGGTIFSMIETMRVYYV